MAERRFSRAGRTVCRSRSIAVPILLGALVGLGVACRRDEAAPTRVEDGDFVLEARLDPGRPRVGENVLEISLHRANGDPVDDAHVAVRVEMDAMGAMPAMGGPASVEAEGEGRYRAAFSLAMLGRWQVAIEAHVPDAPALEAEGHLTVGTPDLRLTPIGAPRETQTGAHTESRAHPAEVAFSAERLQKIGVTTTSAVRRALPTTVAAVGRVIPRENDQVDVSFKLRGWASRVRVAAVGAPVTRGEVLFEAYSPELVAAQQEYVEALRSQVLARETTAPDRADALVEAAKSRLRRFDLDAPTLSRLERTQEIAERVPVRAPASGFVVEKNVVEGSAFAAGDRLYRIASLARVWIEAEIPESDAATVAVGARATIAATHRRGAPVEARVDSIQPVLDPMTRRVRARIEVANPDTLLRPNMLAEVEIEAMRGADEAVSPIVVPQSAVLAAGERSFVFVALGEGRFRPQAVVTGRRIGEDVEIASGLAEGDRVVRSGTFLIAAESRLRAAMEQW